MLLNILLTVCIQFSFVVLSFTDWCSTEWRYKFKDTTISVTSE